MSNIKNETPIYLDQEGYTKLLTSIEELKLRLNENNKGRKAAFDAGAGDGWDSPELEEIERNEAMIMGELQRRYDELSRVVIIEKKENSETVEIGDTIKLHTIFSEDKFEEKLFKIVGGMPNFNLDVEIQEISINSPIGKAIYQKQIGETCKYSVNNRQFKVLIKEKIDLSKQQSGPTKKLKK